MPNLGNAWHIPTVPKPRGRAGMRTPAGAIVPGATITIYSGNQYQGGGNPGNQLQVGSALFFKRATDVAWQTLPLSFDSAFDNDKFYRAVIPPATFATLDVVQYYLCIAYSDHDTTFLAQGAGASVTVASEAEAQATPFTFTVEDSAVLGQWGPLFDLPNVGIHANLLPNGRVLMWGRRDLPTQTLDEHECTPFIWDPANGSTTFTNQPTRANANDTVNLFCSGHAFLPDGRLLVVGGHWLDEDGINQACLFDFNTGLWTATAPMTAGGGAEVRRWYPTARTLADGTVLVFSGSYLDRTQPAGQQTRVVDLLQIWDNGNWKTVPQADNSALDYDNPPLYPRLHGASDGRLLMSGPNDRTLLLKTTKPGAWTDPAFRSLGERQYAPAVQYDRDQVIYIGGGNAADTNVPSAGAEVIDLSATPPRWTRTGDMKFPRRQHNATVLPDGTVLVTGGTRGGGGPNKGFNDLSPGMPVPFPEVWDPSNGTWTVLAAEEEPRCYHATALLLPDGRVLSAGGGEYRPDNVNPNPPEDSHRNAQIFSPPYLFKGPRPSLLAPKTIDYGVTFAVTTDQATAIRKVTLTRLASVTHSFDENQHVVFLGFSSTAATLNVTAPASANECPPGHYMLFLVNAQGVPSVASIVNVRSVPGPLNAALANALAAAEAAPSTSTARPRVYLSAYAPPGPAERTGNGTAVRVGLTGTCPYGIGACWGGAYEALGRLASVARVGPAPNTADSTAEVFLNDASLPPLDLWQNQFRSIVNGSYILRGVELTLRGTLELAQNELFLQSASPQATLRLAALTPIRRLQWDHVAQARKPPLPGELEAYARLFDDFRQPRRGSETLTVTGPLETADDGYRLFVREFSWGS